MAPTYIASTSLDGSRVHGLWRVTDGYIYERFDRGRQIWVEDRAGIRFTGIGGDSDFDQITRADAIKLLRGWGTR